jgi:predicted small lipoprotein YifL
MRRSLATALVLATLAACGEDVPLGTLEVPDAARDLQPPNVVDEDAGDAAVSDAFLDQSDLRRE